MTMQNSKIWIATIVIIVLILVGIFYWFQLRPTKIRKECSRIVNNREGFIPGKFAAEYTGKTYFDEEGYRKCLLEHGLEK